jgi:hypothetical protein
MQAYSDETRAQDPYSLPDIEVFQMTAREVAEQDEERIYEYMKRPKFRLATMHHKTREAMFDTMIEEEGIEGGWFYWYCAPGCLPDSEPVGPYESAKQAKQAVQDDAQDD